MKGSLVWIHLDSQSMPWGCFSANFLTNSEKRKFSHYFELKSCTYQLLSACHRSIKLKIEIPLLTVHVDSQLCHGSHINWLQDQPREPFSSEASSIWDIESFFFSQWSFPSIISQTIYQFSFQTFHTFYKINFKIKIEKYKCLSELYGETLAV